MTTTALVAAAVAFAAFSGSANAQAIWQGATTDYNTAGNWSTNNVPDAAGESASFQNTGSTTIVVNTAVAPDSWAFANNSQAYSISGSAVTLANGLTYSGVVTSTVSNVISGGGSVNVNSGHLNLDGANTYTGGTNINAGTLGVKVNNGLGTGTITIAGGGTLQTNQPNGSGNITLNNASVVLSGGTSIIRTNGQGLGLVLNGTVSGPGALQKANGGILLLNGTNTYQGGTNFNGGALGIGGNSALGTGNVFVGAATGQILASAGNVTVGNQINFGAGTSTTFTNNGAGNAAANNNRMTLTGNLGGSGAIVVNMNPAADPAGGGRLTLGGSGTNTFSGGVTYNSGTLGLGKNSALGTGALTVNAATGRILVQAGSLAVGNNITLTAGTNTQFTNPGTIGSTNNNNMILTGQLSGTGNIVVNMNPGGDAAGGGFLALAGNNSGWGGTLIDVQSGALGIGQDTSAGAAAITLQNNTALSLNSVGNPVVSLANTINFNGADTTINTQMGKLTLTGTLTSNQALPTIHLDGDGGTLVLNEANPVAPDAKIVIEAATTAGNHNTLSLATSNALSAASTIQTNGSIIDYANGVNNAAAIVVNSNTTQLQVLAGASATQSGVISEIGGARPIEKIGDGALTLSGTNLYSGGTTISAGTLVAGNAQALGNPNTGSVTVKTGATLDLGGFTVIQDGGVHLTGGTIQNGTLNSLGTFDLQSGTVSAVLGSGGSVSKTTAGTVTLSGANTYSGGTSVSDGTLALTGAGTLGNAGSTTTVSGGTLDFGGTLQAQGTLNQSGGTVQNGAINVGTYQLTGGTLAADATVTATTTFDMQNGTVNGVLTGGGVLNKTTAGTVTLAGGNSYTGGTTVSAGTLMLSGIGSLGLASNALAVSGGTLDLGGTSHTQGSVQLTGGTIQNGTLTSTTAFDLQAGTASANLAGTAGATKTTGGTVTLSGDNSGLTGGFNLNAGTVAIGSNTALGTGQVNMADTTTLQAAANNLNVGNAIALAAGTEHFDVQAFTLTLSGNLTGTGTIDKVGSGNLILSGDNSGYSGNMTLESGTVTASHDNAFGTGTVTVADNVTISVTANPVTLSNNFNFGNADTLATNGNTLNLTGSLNIAAGNELFQTGTGTVVLTGNNAGFLGTYVLQGGTVSIGTSASSVNIRAEDPIINYADGVNNGGGIVLAANDVQLQVLAGATATQSGVISENAAGRPVEKIGGGTLILSAANTYTGLTTVTGGTLQLSATGSVLGGVNNNATFDNAGTVSGGFTNTAGAASNSGTINGGATITGGTFTQTAGSTNGGLTNNATVDLNGGAINGAIVNNLTFNVGGTSSSDNTFGNSAGANLNVNAGTYTLTGLLTNDGTVTVAAGATLTANGGFTNDGGGVVTNNGTVNDDLNNAGAYTNNGTDNANVASNTGTIDNNGTWNGNVITNAGTINNNLTGTWNGDVNSNGGTINNFHNWVTQATGFNNDTGTLNQNAGTLDATIGGLSNGGTVNANGGAFMGAITNTGTFNVLGTVTGNSTFDNNGTAQLLVTGGNFTGLTTLTNNSTNATGIQITAGNTLSANSVVNSAGATINNAGTLSSLLTALSNAGTLTTTGTVNGGLINTGTVNAAGAVNGAIANNGAGTFTVTGNLVGNNTFDNNGTAQLLVTGGDFTGITTLTNNSTNATGISIGAGFTLAANTVTNNAGATLVNSGTLTSTTVVTNAGTLTNNAGGTINGGLSNSNTFNNSGTLNGGLTNTAGTTTNGGTINGGATVTGGTLTTTGTVNGGLTNSATVNAQGTISGAILNQGAGTFTVTGNLVGDNTFDNNGTAQLLVTGGNFTGITTLTNNSTNATGISIGAGFTLAANAVSNNAGATLVNAGTLTSTTGTANAGTLTNNAGGIINGGVANSGTLTNNAGATINNGVANSATFGNAGTLNGGLANTAGTTTNTGTINNGMAVSGGTVDNTTGTINGGFAQTGGTINNASTIHGGGSITTGTYTQTAGLLDGGLTTAGTVNANGGAINGGITNQGAGVFTVGGTVTTDNTFDNNGTAQLIVSAGNSFTGITTLTNNSTAATGVSVGAGSTLGVATLTNSAGSTLSAGAGSTISSPGALVVTNNGTMTLAGTTFSGATSVVATNNGTMNVNGPTSFVGTTTSSLTNSLGAILNQNGTTLTVNGPAGGTFTNAGTFNMNGDNTLIVKASTINNLGVTNVGTVPGVAGSLNIIGDGSSTMTVNNGGVTAGTYNINGTANFGGLVNSTFNNVANGTITMQNGIVTDAVQLNPAVLGAHQAATPLAYSSNSVAYNYVGTAGSQLNVDINLGLNTANQRADLLSVSGQTSGATTVNFNSVGTPGYFAQPIPIVMSTTQAAGTTFTAAGLPTGAGPLTYSFVPLTGGANCAGAAFCWAVQANLNLNSIAQAATGITSALASIETGFHQSASALVASAESQLPNKVSSGLWVRADYGRTKISAEGSLITPVTGVPVTAGSLMRTTYAGFQVGADSGLLNIQGTGWNGHIGLTGGQVKSQSAEQYAIGNLDLNIPFFGIYGAFRNGPWFGDLTVRHDWYNASADNSMLFNGPYEFKGHGTSVNTSFGYHWQAGTWFLEPQVGFTWLRANFDDVTIQTIANSLIRIGNLDSKVGRATLRTGTTFTAGNFAVQPFFTASVLREFSDDATPHFMSGTTDITISTTRVGTFGQFGFGVSAQPIGSSLVTFIRGDLRTGSHITGASITGGARYTFN